MRLGQMIELVQDEVNDASARQYSRAMVVRAINLAHQEVYMMQVQEDRSFHNCELTIDGALGRAIHRNITRYPLPHYIDRVSSVWVKSADGGDRGQLVCPSLGLDQMGWSLFAGSQLEVRGLPAQTVRVYGIKTPALLTRGPLPDQSGLSDATRQVRLPTMAAVEYPYDPDTTKYKNSIIEIVGKGTNAELRSGQVRRILTGARPVLFSGNAHSVVTVDQPWDVAPVAVDEFDMRLETPEAASTLIRLRAAITLYRSTGAYESAASVESRMRQTEHDFREFIQPREDHMEGTVYEPQYLSSLTSEMDTDGGL